MKYKIQFSNIIKLADNKYISFNCLGNCIQKSKDGSTKLLFLMVLLASSLFVNGQQSDTLKHYYKVGLRQQFEPFEFLNENNKPDGFTPNLLKEIGKSANITFEFFPMTFKQTIDALNKGQVDLICLVYSPERAKLYGFSNPHCLITQALFQKDGNNNIVNLNSLTGHSIGFIEDDILLDTFANRTDFKKHIVLSKIDGFLHLQNNQFDAFICGEQNGLKLISEYDFPNINLVSGNLFPREYAFATSKKNQQLIQLLNKNLAELKTSGKLQKLTDKWLSSKPQTSGWIKKHQTFLITILSIFTGLIIFLMFWNWLLRSTVNEKTKRIKESEEKYRGLVDHSPDAIVIYVDGIIVFVNHECLRLMCAATENDLIGKNVVEFIHPDYRAFVIERMKKASIQETVLPIAEEKFIRLDGSLVEVEVKAMPIMFENEPAVQLIVRDITERKQAEQALQDSEKRFNILFMDSPDAYLLIVDGIFVECNRTSENMLRGYRTQIIGQSPNSISPEFQPDGRKSSEAAEKMINNTLQDGNSTFDWIHQRFDGSELYVEVSLASIMLDGKQTLFTTWRDISKRKFVEETLQNERLLLRTVIDNIPDAVYTKDLACRKTLANLTDIQNIGAKLESEILGKTDFELFSKELASNFFADDQTVLHTGKPVLNREEYVIDDKGSICWLLTSKLPLRDKNNQIIGIVGIGRNITTQKKMEESLRESEELYRTLVENMPDGIYKSTHDGKFISTNPALVKILGYESKEELMCIDIKTQLYFEPSDRDDLLLDEGMELGIYRLKKKDGSEIWVEDHEWYSINDNGEILFHVGVIRDVTDRKLAEQALSNSQEQLKNFAAHLQNVREEERTILAREIHDELGQILIALKIDLGMLKQKVLMDNDKSDSKNILATFDQLSSLVDNTIKTTRKIMTGLRPETLDLIGFIESAKIYLSEFQERFKINCQFESDISKMDMNSQQLVALFRILQESLTNVARHAKASKVKVQLSMQTNKLIMEIIDNGIGFNSNQKIKNDSYGLIGMRERILLLEGELFIIGQIDQGTTVRIEIPYLIPKPSR